MISAGLKHGFEHRTPRVRGSNRPLQTPTPSFNTPRSIRVDHKLGNKTRVSEKAATTFSLGPSDYKFAGQPATATFDGLTLRAGKRTAPVGR